MKRIAVITPCILPVPDNLGGAVERLITKLITENEHNKEYIIDLFTIDYDKRSYGFSYTNLVYIKPSKTAKIFDRLLDKYYRTVPCVSSHRMLDSYISKSFLERLEVVKGQYDFVIIENMMSTACEILHICQGKYDFPIYFHMHNDVDIYRSPASIKELVQNGVQFIAVSNYIKAQILKADHNAIVSVLYNGIDLHKYDRKIMSDVDAINLLYAGRIIPGKGVKELLSALISLIDKDESYKKKVRLDIVGFSGLDKRYENAIRRMAEGYINVSCIGQISSDEMADQFNKADIVIMPSIVEESFGLVALETMAKGIPLITTNSGALPEVVGNNACVVDKSENLVKNLSEAIVRLVNDSSYRKELSEIGYKRAHAIKDFDIINYYNNFRNIIEPKKIDSEDVISVIVPVYNVSAYLRRCLSSIMQQTYNNLEIILIDDGSTDDSGEICDELKISDGRIKVVHQKNQGLPCARNSGLDIATGKYVFFCDSDDYIKENTLEKMLLKLKKDHSDIVACGFCQVYDEPSDNGIRTVRFTNPNPGRWSGYRSVIEMMRNNNVCTVAWNKLYKKELFDGIRYPANVFHEDEATTYKLLYKADIVSYIPDELYMYYQRDFSIIHEELVDRYKFFIDILWDRIAYFSEKQEEELVQHSKITLLDWIKYSYRNIHDRSIRNELLGLYSDNISFANAPAVMGTKKELALLAWKYYRY